MSRSVFFRGLLKPNEVFKNWPNAAIQMHDHKDYALGNCVKDLTRVQPDVWRHLPNRGLNPTFLYWTFFLNQFNAIDSNIKQNSQSPVQINKKRSYFRPRSGQCCDYNTMGRVIDVYLPFFTCISASKMVITQSSIVFWLDNWHIHS